MYGQYKQGSWSNKIVSNFISGIELTDFIVKEYDMICESMNISNKNKNSFQKNYNRFNKDSVFSNVFTARLGLDGTVAHKEIEDFVLKEKFYKKSFEVV